jgi:hypothetical protein
MAKTCSHLDTHPAGDAQRQGCEECLTAGGWRVHLRLCRTCGHVGCGDASPREHVAAIITPPSTRSLRAMTSPKAGPGSYQEEIVFDLGDDTTPQVGPIPRFV